MIWTALVWGCRSATEATSAPVPSAASPAEAASSPACHDELPAAASGEGSLYDLDLALETTVGAATVDLHRGHPVLIAMFYASCQQACPMTIAKIQGIEARLSPADRARLRVLLVSLDPDRDTIAALRELSTRHQLDDRWTVARTADPQVRELAAALGVRYRKLADGTIAHSTVIAMLDGEGIPRARVEGLGASDDALVAAIQGR